MLIFYLIILFIWQQFLSQSCVIIKHLKTENIRYHLLRLQTTMQYQYIIPDNMRMKKKMNLFIQTDNNDISSQLRQPSYLYAQQNDQFQKTIEPLNFKRIQTEQRIEALPADRDAQDCLSNYLLNDLGSQYAHNSQEIKNTAVISSNQKYQADKRIMLNVQAVQKDYQNLKSFRNCDPPIAQDFKLNLVTSPKKFLLLKTNTDHKKQEKYLGEQNCINQNKNQIVEIDQCRPVEIAKPNQPQRKKIMQFKNISMAQLKKQLHQAKTIIKSLKQQPKVCVKNKQKDQKYSIPIANIRNQSYQRNSGQSSYRYTGRVYKKQQNTTQNSRIYRMQSQPKDIICFNSRRPSSKKYLTLKDANIQNYRSDNSQ